MFVCIDGRNRITGYNPNNMAGNSGWKPVKNEISEPLFNDNNVPFYKYAESMAVLRTAGEIEIEVQELEKFHRYYDKQQSDVADMRAALDVIYSGEVGEND